MLSIQDSTNKIYDVTISHYFVTNDAKICYEYKSIGNLCIRFEKVPYYEVSS